jgi:hypothetical protein
MDDRPQKRAIRGAALAPLTGAQIRDLVLLSKRVHETHDKLGMLAEADADFDTWRHRQTMQIVERSGLTQCRQEDYLPLRAHFLQLLGYKLAARRDWAKSATDDIRQALAVLRQEKEKARDVIDDPHAYVDAIARSKYKTGLIESDLAAKQIWTLVFDIRRAAQQRRKRRAA